VETTADLVQEFCDAVEAGDYARAVTTITPDALVRGTVGGIDEGLELRGAEAAVKYFDEVADTWDEWHLQPEQVLNNGDTFVVFWRETSRSRGLEIVNQTASVLRIRDGKIGEWQGYLDRAKALEAAGLG
jgi:ketosteroid isomerase-like protein